MKRWVNAQTSRDSFTALHYASYMGNYELCKLLIEIGADTDTVNLNGLNVLHIAAQGDQPVTLYYFHKIVGMSITCKDFNGSTPLHWACYSNSELALIYISSWMKTKDFAI